MPASSLARSVLAVLFCGLAAMPATAAPASLRVVLDDNYPPYSFRTPEGSPQGILKDLWALWQERTGIAVEFMPMPWAQARATMERNEADVIDTLFETAEQRKQYDFSAPYAAIEVSLAFHESIVSVTDAESVRGLAIGVKAGDACIDYLTAHGIDDLRHFPDYEAQVQGALRREIRVLCIARPPATYFFSRSGMVEQYRYSPPLYVGQFHWAVARGRGDLKEVIEQGFARITPAERQAIEQRWLGQAVPSRSSHLRQAGYVLAGLTLLTGTLFGWSWALRRQVRHRTHELATTLGALSRTEERFRSLFEQANDAIFIIRDGAVIHCNRRAETMYRRPREILIGQKLAALAPPIQPNGMTTQAWLAQVTGIAERGQPVVFEWQDLLPDGSPLDVEVNLSQIDYDGTPCLHALVRDVSERKLHEQQIHGLLAEQRLIFDNAHVGILMLRQRRILKCNQRIAEMFGFSSPAELEGHSTEIFYCDRAQFEAAGRQGYSGLAEAGHASFEAKMCRRDGQHIWVIQTGRPLDRNAVLDGASIWVYTDITDRKLAEEALRESRLMFSSAFESSPLAASIADFADGRFIEVNANYARDFGWPKEELIGRTSIEVGLWPDTATRDAWLAAIRRSPRLLAYPTRWRTRNGELRDVSLSSDLIELTGRTCILAYVADITAEKQAADNLRIAATAFESQEAMLVTDVNGVILRVNRAFTESTGYTAEEVVGQTPRLFKSGRHDAGFYEHMWATVIASGSWQGEIWDRRKNGEIYPKWMTISAVHDAAGRITHYVGTHFDITERKLAEERIQSLAFTDQLTGLANRFSLGEWLAQALPLTARNEQQLAMMMIDLDNFKSINDTLGHPVGDRLLLEIARRLKAAVRQTDLVARLGGDEFVIVLADVGTPSDAAHVADKILSVTATPCIIDGHDLRTGASIGICLFPGDAQAASELIKKADVAMYHAKSKGRGNYQFFREEIQQAAVARLALESDLRKAIEQRQFLLHYQPQVDLRSGRIAGVEALIRWQHPTRGLVSPLDFIPLAEETGLILPIGDWVLEQSCRQLAEWRTQGIDGLQVSVNLTASQFQSSALPDRIEALLRQYDILPERLNLEITESMSMTSPEQSVRLMKELTDRGLTLAIDDFGTGYSSLAYLKTFPVTALKIDRSFVMDIEVDQDNAEICDVAVLLAHKLGLEVVAEGVETEAQLKYLRSIGCEKIQGYLISRPLPAGEIASFIASAAPVAGPASLDLWLPAAGAS